MKKAIVFVAALTLIAVSDAFAERVVAGVNMDAVPWAELCPNVEPVELKTGAGTCPVSHPASYKHAAWDGSFGMGVKERKPNCKKFEKEYKRLISPRINTTEQTKVKSRWGTCIGAFSRALNQRTKEEERFSEPFSVWRERYFANYLSEKAK